MENQNVPVNIEDSVNALTTVIGNECSYDSMGKDGRLVNPGKLLVKYGDDCDYSIRDKYWDVYPHKTNKNGIVVEWETQETPIYPAINMLREAIDLAGLTACTVTLNIWDRDGEDEITEIVSC